MPFQYPQYRNPYVGSLTDLIMRPGEAQAAAAERIGQAQAQAQLQSGNAWANAAQNIGQSVAAIPQELQKQKETALRTQLLGQNVAAGAQQVSDLRALDAAFTAPGGRDAILDKLPGHLKPQVIKQFQEADKLGADVQSSQLAAEQKTNDYVTNLAEQVDSHGNDPAAMMMAVKHAEATFVNNPSLLQQVGQFKQALLANPTPDGVKAITAPILAAKKATEKLTPVGAGGLFNPATNTTIPPAPKVGEGQHVINGQLVGPDGQPIGGPIPKETDPVAAARELETARHNKEMEQIGKLQVGRETAANRETARHNAAMEQANNPLGVLLQGGAQATPGTTAPGQAAPAAAPPNPTGEAVLATVPPQIASTVKALAEGRMAFPAGFALKSPYWQAMIALVGQYDPTFDAVNYNSRSRTRADFTSGAAAKNINALNTVAQHLDRLSTSTDALSNTWSPEYNTVANFISKHTGNPVVTNFETDKKAVVDELTRVWRQSGGSAADIADRSKVLDAANSPAQLHGAIKEMGNLIEGKLSALESQYKQGMGTSEAGIQVVTPAARAVLDRLEQKASGTAPAGEATTAAKEGDVKPIPGFPGTEQTFKNGKWIRTK